MLTLCDTCAIKNGSKPFNFDVGGRYYLGRGWRTKCQVDSVAAPAGGNWYLHPSSDVRGLNALLWIFKKFFNLLISMSKRQLCVD